MPNVELDDLILEELEDQFDEICQYQSCDQTRTHLLLCPQCPAIENMCEPHAQMAKNAGPRDYIIFNRSCNHNVRMMDCGKVRIT